MAIKLSTVKTQGHLHGYISNEWLLFFYFKQMPATPANAPCWGWQALGGGGRWCAEALRSFKIFYPRCFKGGKWARTTESRWTTPGGCWGKLGLKACRAVASGKRQIVMNYSEELWMLLSRYVSAKEYVVVPASILTSLIFETSNCQYSLFYNYALLC